MASTLDEELTPQTLHRKSEIGMPDSASAVGSGASFRHLQRQHMSFAKDLKSVYILPAASASYTLPSCGVSSGNSLSSTARLRKKCFGDTEAAAALQTARRVEARSDFAQRQRINASKQHVQQPRLQQHLQHLQSKQQQEQKESLEQSLSKNSAKSNEEGRPSAAAALEIGEKNLEQKLEWLWQMLGMCFRVKG
ncbi:hypothetical protein cyc_02081 [Cyclospora cayetanensis]|uniref:Uncharacterized protein n=1 Tax=Cyclospora cayetanensis TaxID=88456 RepID=A0A1D3D0A8_9EIME|nr:hypothetical protein cyc_02081 [Cyclospora cayetanensis]